MFRHNLGSVHFMNFTRNPLQVWFQNRRMKDKRQKMTLTWPCGDPMLAAYVLQQAAAATGMQLGPAGPGPTGYPGGLFAAAAAAAAAAAVSSSPFGPMMAPRPPGLPPPPPPHPFVSPISSASTMPHRPTPNILTPHVPTQHHTHNPQFLPSGGCLSPRSPPIEGGVIIGSAFSPTTPPASCDSSSNLNLGQVSPQTTTKTDLPHLMKKERDYNLGGGKEQSLESRQDRKKDINVEDEAEDCEEKRQSFNCLKSIDQRKRKRGSSSGSSSSLSPSHSPSENCIVFPFSDAKKSKNNVSPSSHIIRKEHSPSSLDTLTGLYMVKSRQNNTIIGQDTALPSNGMKSAKKDLIHSKAKHNHDFSNEDDSDGNPKVEKDISLRDGKANLRSKNSTRMNCRSVSPSTAGTTASSSSTSASLFQPYLDIEKK